MKVVTVTCLWMRKEEKWEFFTLTIYIKSKNYTIMNYIVGCKITGEESWQTFKQYEV